MECLTAHLAYRTTSENKSLRSNMTYQKTWCWLFFKSGLPAFEPVTFQGLHNAPMDSDDTGCLSIHGAQSPPEGDARSELFDLVDVNHEKTTTVAWPGQALPVFAEKRLFKKRSAQFFLPWMTSKTHFLLTFSYTNVFLRKTADEKQITRKKNPEAAFQKLFFVEFSLTCCSAEKTSKKKKINKK